MNLFNVFLQRAKRALPGFLLAVCCLSAARAQQTQGISGLILDIEGRPMVGVTVVVKDTTRGTTSGFDGHYEMDGLTPGATIVFSFLGYQTEEVVYQGQTVQNIVMRQASTEMEDVVVVGYGTQKKESVTGALSGVKPQVLERTATVSLSNSIGGAMPGIITRQSTSEPGNDSAAIFIRGMGTWQNRNPLILVDGVERDMNLINVAEIESVTVLKDASATAVYGVRGANGVILINTKKGRMGKPQVVFRTEFASLHGLRFPQYISGYEFASLMNEATRNGGGPAASLPWTEEELLKFRDGSDPYLYPDTDWVGDVLKKNSFQTINNLSISGGNEIVRYFVNVGYTSQSGLFREDPGYDYRTNSRSDRYNFRSNVDVNVSKNLVLSLGLGGIIQDKTYPGTASDEIFAQMRQVSPIQMPRQNPDGTPGSAGSAVYLNPWALATQSGYSKQFINTLQGTFNLSWDLSSLVTEGLSLSAKFSYDFYYFNNVNRHITYGMKRYMGKDDGDNDIYMNVRNAESMAYGVTNTSNRAYYYDFGLNYDRTFGRHHVMAMLLFNRRDYKDLTAGNSMLNLPYRRQGLAGRLTYDYAGRHLAEFNFGYNGSENFRKGSRYGFFPSASLGWVVSGEEFWQRSGFLKDIYFKLRGSYGVVGNDQISNDRFLYLSTVNTNANGGLFGSSQTGIVGYSEYKIGADVTWEKAYKADIGIELRFLKDRLSLQGDFFDEDRRDILLERKSIPNVTGISTAVYANMGHVRNRGVDAVLEWRDTSPGGFYYSFYGNFTYAHNHIVEDDTPHPRYDWLETRGRRIDQPFGYIALGFFTCEEEIADSPTQTFMTEVRPGDVKYLDLNGDGKITPDDRAPIGFARTPEIMFGFGGSMAYKGVDFSFSFTGATRVSTFLMSEDMLPYSLEYPRYNISREYYDNRWIPGAADNSKAKYPAVINGNNPNNYQKSTLYLRDASYLRLKSAEIGYTLPERWSRKLRIEKIRVFVNGTNLFCLDGLKIVDPEADTGTGNYPQQRTINGGVQINF